MLGLRLRLLQSLGVLLLQLRAGGLVRLGLGLHAGIGLVLQLGGQTPHQLLQGLTHRHLAACRAALLLFNFFQIAVDGGFRACITQLSTHCINRRVAPLRQQALTRSQNLGFVDTTSGHSTPACYFILFT